MMFPYLIFDPIYLLIAVFGYVLMFILASYVAPKVANKFSGKFSLYSSMLIVSLLIVFSFSFVLFVIFYFLSLYLEINIQDFSQIFISLTLFILISNVIVYVFSPILINLMYGAQEDEKIQKIVDEVKKELKYRGKIKGVITKNFRMPNAFAYGNFIFGRYIAVSPGMLNLVNEKELKAVIGHEIGHHMHRDNFIMLLFGILPSIIYYFGYLLIRLSISQTYSNRRNSRGAGLILLLIGVFSVAMSFIVQILVLAFSRLREYFSDLEGAKAAGKRNMQSSLVKIHYYYSANIVALKSIDNSKIKTLFIYAFIQTLANPIKEISEKDIEKIKQEEVSPLQEFLSTHPPIPKRLKFLDFLPY